MNRVSVSSNTQWESIGRAHGEVFGSIRPAATMVEVSRLIDPEHLVEIEVDAIVQDSVLQGCAINRTVMSAKRHLPGVSTP